MEDSKPDLVVGLSPIAMSRSLNLTKNPDQFCASMWTSEESRRIQTIARELVLQVRTLALPQGLQAEKGPDVVVEYIKERLPDLIED